MDKEQSYLIELSRAYLNEEKISLKSDIDYKRLYSLAREHNLCGVLYCAVKNAENRDIIEKELFSRLENTFFDLVYASNMQVQTLGELKALLSQAQIRYLLIKNKRSAHWGFPKGHIEPGETKKETAIREVLEETGVHVKIIDGYESVSKYKIQNRIEKIVSIFVGTTTDTSTSIQPEEISDYIWLTYDRALSILKFENDKSIIISAHKFLNDNNYI